MRAYNVHIEAEDATGNKIEFVEVVEYPGRPLDSSGCVPEWEREAKGVAQVKRRMPHLRNVRAKWSIHV